MFGFIAQLIGGALSPLIDQVTAFGASLLRKLALFLVAAICMVVVVIALTIAFDLWIASLAGGIVGALAVAGLYLAIAVVAVVLAMRGGRPAEQADRGVAAEETVAAEKDEKVDQFTAPILAMLASLGLRREQIAVLAGASLAKRWGRYRSSASRSSPAFCWDAFGGGGMRCCRANSSRASSISSHHGATQPPHRPRTRPPESRDPLSGGAESQLGAAA